MSITVVKTDTTLKPSSGYTPVEVRVGFVVVVVFFGVTLELESKREEWDASISRKGLLKVGFRHTSMSN